MIPSIDTRLASMLSTLNGVIRPALGAGQPFAAEQAHLLMAHIGLLRAQEPMAEEFEQLDYNRTRAFVQDLLDGAAGGSETTAAAAALKKLLAAPVPFSMTAIRAAQDTFAAGIGALIEAIGKDGTEAAMTASARSTIEHERVQSLRYRSYFSMMGYEDGSRDIAKPEAMMAEFRAAHGAHPGTGAR